MPTIRALSGLDEVTAVTDVTQAVPPPMVADCLVVVYERGGAPGKCFPLDRAQVFRIGRDLENEIVLDDDGVSRRHAKLERRADRVVVMDVGSRNGTLLNDRELLDGTELKSGDRLKVGSTIFKYLSGTDLEASLHEQIYANTITDELTQLHNRRSFDEQLSREFYRARRYERPLSLLIADIDHFKGVNDRYGHHVGDIALRSVAQVIRGRLRSGDVVARFGGEEIAALLPETGLAQAMSVAEDLRQAVAARAIRFRGGEVRVTVSIGCAELAPEDASSAQFFSRCDTCVYAAKDAGRNTVRP